MDAASTTDLLNGQLQNIVDFLAATGALGTAAYGLVDLTKATPLSISKVGLDRIRAALMPFRAALEEVSGQRNWDEVIRAQWVNGAAKADQKATAKSLIHLGLNKDNAEQLAGVCNIDAAPFLEAVGKMADGVELAPQEVGILGRFDAVVDARLDAAYEHADQQYRNAARALAAGIAVVLAVIAGAVVYADSQGGNKLDYYAYFWSYRVVLAAVVGLISVPLAPVAKDLASALTTAVQAVRSAKV